MIAPKHILGTFDEALASLAQQRSDDGEPDRTQPRPRHQRLLQRDDDLCAIAIADDEEIDQLEKQIDKDGVDLLLRFQPVASDLRRVVSAMKLSSNLERMADQATNIARRARKLNQHPAAAGSGIDCADVCRMRWRCSRTASMLMCAKMCELGAAVVPRDEELDELNRQASRKLIERMAQDPDQLRGYLNLIFISRCLERVGDHATNIAEDAVYAAAAEDIRHQPFVAPA